MTMEGAAMRERVQVQTIIIGAGQAGLSMGYHLANQGVPFLILEGNERVGDSWRKRWDSLKLFTPARFNGLDGMPYPGPRWREITKDEMGDYLESYARHFSLPVETGARVRGLSREGNRYVIDAGTRQYEAEHVVVAMASYQEPRVPGFARELRPDIVQMHSRDYKNPAQLRDGPVLLVGAGNSGAEIARETVKTHPTLLAGPPTGQIPFQIDGFAAQHGLLHLEFRVLFHRVMSLDTPIGRKVHGRGHGATPLIRVKEKDLRKAGVERLSRVVGVKDGLPVLQDGRVLDVANVIWCTGFDPGFSWINLPVLDGQEPKHHRGIVPGEPGLYFVGLHFLYAMSSTMVHGVGRDAEYIAKEIGRRVALQQGAVAASQGPRLVKRDSARVA
jgi:putative flavoprotein involved in K+ transport